MHNFQPVPVDFFEKSPFELIGKDWMLITALKDNKVNTMTASWGGLGVMWGKNVAFIVVRNSRYTKEFIDGSTTFSLSFFDEKYKTTLKYLGAVSGRDEDKISNAKLKVQIHEPGETPFIDEANLVLICRKMYMGELGPDGFQLPQIQEQWYKDEDYHVLYIGEITEILAR
ncbi:MAG: flavin reductase family protein [Lachnospiraceae bacterium]|nr:flavin reductase family protein [Lachnospiraceae bacterium]